MVIVPASPITQEKSRESPDRCGNAGCTDASIRGHAEGIELLFERTAELLQAGLSTASAEVKRTGYRVSKGRVNAKPCRYRVGGINPSFSSFAQQSLAPDCGAAPLSHGRGSCHWLGRNTPNHATVPSHGMTFVIVVLRLPRSCTRAVTEYLTPA